MSSEDDFLNSLRDIFAVEADEHRQAMISGLLALERAAPENRAELIEAVFRAAHSLKGAARAVNELGIESICQNLEDRFATWKRGQAVPDAESIDPVHRALDEIAAQLSQGSSKASIPAPNPQPLAERPSGPAPKPRPVLPRQLPAVPTPNSLPIEFPTTERGASGETIRISVAKLDARLLEAEEMLTAKLATNQRALDLHAVTARFATWQKQWSSIQTDLRSLRRIVERDGEAVIPAARINSLLEFLEWNHDFLRAAEVAVNGLSQHADQDAVAIGRLVDDLLEDSKRLLMLPLATLGTLLPKIVRDICRDQGKEADLIIRGEDVEIDKRILEEMKDPLIHLLRNCVDHGIETPEKRRQAGKAERASIHLSVSPINGSKVELTVSDDGAGIDVDSVKAAAVRKGFINAEEAAQLSASAAHQLIFQTDLSTSAIITELSGRGLGLAIVRERSEKLGGNVTVESRPNLGTTFRITLPAALATFRGILVLAHGRQLVVPTAQVERVTRYRDDDVRTVEGRETLSLDGRPIPVVRLGDVLELPPPPSAPKRDAPIPAIVLGSADQRIAFAIDEVLDEQEVLVKHLRKPLSRVRNIAGATVLGSGQVAPILHIGDLLKSARLIGKPSPKVQADARKADVKAIRVLIAEDSITSRMLLKGILESAGYQVKTAVDGLEAFTTLRAEPFDLVVSDVEMPRLNGFDLTARIRADPKLAKTPVILVTALETREDREHGIDAGANAYLVKSSFDQSNLLEAVRRLV